MTEGDLQGCLSGVREHTTGKAKQDLSANHTGATGRSRGSTVMDEESEGNHEEHGAGDDEDLEASDLEDHEAQDEAGDDADERVERGHARGILDAEIKRDYEDCVEVGALQVPGQN